MNRPIATLALLLSVGVTSCNADAITSSENGLRVLASISDAAIGPDESATVTYRLRNVGRAPRTVSALCALLPYVEDATGATVYPGGGQWGCIALLVPPVTLAPGEEIVQTLVLNGGPETPPGSSVVRLPPGRYAFYAEFAGSVGDVGKRVQLRSRNLGFEIAG
jgi:hypothetical protein